MAQGLARWEGLNLCWWQLAGIQTMENEVFFDENMFRALRFCSLVNQKPLFSILKLEFLKWSSAETTWRGSPETQRSHYLELKV